MNLPTTFGVPMYLRDEVSRWVDRTNIECRISHFWPFTEISFENEEDAMAFSLAFGLERKITPVERMIKDEEILFTDVKNNYEDIN